MVVPLLAAGSGAVAVLVIGWICTMVYVRLVDVDDELRGAA